MCQISVEILACHWSTTRLLAPSKFFILNFVGLHVLDSLLRFKPCLLHPQLEISANCIDLAEHIEQNRAQCSVGLW
jgi:hypothetical protein